MNRPVALVLFVPAYLVLLAADECGTSQNANTERCAASVDVVVEQGSTSAPIPNVCTTRDNTNVWLDSKWSTKTTVELPLEPVNLSEIPATTIIGIKAPADLAEGTYVGSIDVKILGSQCALSTGETGDCVDVVALNIRVVPPGSSQLATIAIVPSVAGTAVSGGIVDIGAEVELKAVVSHAPDGYTVSWDTYSLWAPDVDMDRNVSGMTSEVVTTAPMNEKERMYTVSLLAPGSDQPVATASLILVGRPQGLRIAGPQTAVPVYPGTSYEVAFSVTGGASTEYNFSADLYKVAGSETWSDATFEEFLRDPMQQAAASWVLVEHNNALNCQNMSCVNRPTLLPTFKPTGSQMSEIGAFRVQFSSAGTPTAFGFSHTFARHY